jgi:hypothetical protein
MKNSHWLQRQALTLSGGRSRARSNSGEWIGHGVDPATMASAVPQYSSGPVDQIRNLISDTPLSLFASWSAAIDFARMFSPIPRAGEFKRSKSIQPIRKL